MTTYEIVLPNGETIYRRCGPGQTHAIVAYSPHDGWGVLGLVPSPQIAERRAAREHVWGAAKGYLFQAVAARPTQMSTSPIGWSSIA